MVNARAHAHEHKDTRTSPWGVMAGLLAFYVAAPSLPEHSEQRTTTISVMASKKKKIQCLILISIYSITGNRLDRFKSINVIFLIVERNF